MNWNLNLKRQPFQRGFFDSKARYPAFVGGWGTGKTMVGILKGITLSNYPNNLGLIVRKNYTDLRDSTIRDFINYTEGEVKVGSNKDAALPNGSVIMFRHLDELAGIIQNVNLGWFLIEQAEEFDSDEEFQKLRGRLRRHGVPHQGIIIANTKGHNWIWRLWKADQEKAKARGFELFEATSFDNAHNLPADTIADWRNLEQDKPSAYKRFILNSWEDVDVQDKVIPYEWLMRAVKKKLIHYMPARRVVSCDPAEFGDDHTVIYAGEEGKITDQEITSKKEPMDTAGRIFRTMKDTGAKLAAVDADGLGSAICSRLAELGVNVLRVKSGEKAGDSEHCKNVKAEMWMNAQAWFRDDLVSLPDDDKLIEDLAAHTYTFNSKGQIQIEKKREVKKKLGRSPDQGDAFVLNLWGISKLDREDAEDNDDLELSTAKSYSVKTVFAK